MQDFASKNSKIWPPTAWERRPPAPTAVSAVDWGASAPGTGTQTLDPPGLRKPATPLAIFEYVARTGQTDGQDA